MSFVISCNNYIGVPLFISPNMFNALYITNTDTSVFCTILLRI